MESLGDRREVKCVSKDPRWSFSDKEIEDILYILERDISDNDLQLFLTLAMNTIIDPKDLVYFKIKDLKQFVKNKYIKIKTKKYDLELEYYTKINKFLENHISTFIDKSELSDDDYVFSKDLDRAEIIDKYDEILYNLYNENYDYPIDLQYFEILNQIDYSYGKYRRYDASINPRVIEYEIKDLIDKEDIVYQHYKNNKSPYSKVFKLAVDYYNENINPIEELSFLISMNFGNDPGKYHISNHIIFRNLNMIMLNLPGGSYDPEYYFEFKISESLKLPKWLLNKFYILERLYKFDINESYQLKNYSYIINRLRKLTKEKLDINFGREFASNYQKDLDIYKSGVGLEELIKTQLNNYCIVYKYYYNLVEYICRVINSNNEWKNKETLFPGLFAPSCLLDMKDLRYMVNEQFPYDRFYNHDPSIKTRNESMYLAKLITNIISREITDEKKFQKFIHEISLGTDKYQLNWIFYRYLNKIISNEFYEFEYVPERLRSRSIYTKYVLKNIDNCNIYTDKQPKYNTIFVKKNTEIKLGSDVETNEKLKSNHDSEKSNISDSQIDMDKEVVKTKRKKKIDVVEEVVNSVNIIDSSEIIITEEDISIDNSEEYTRILNNNLEKILKYGRESEVKTESIIRSNYLPFLFYERTTIPLEFGFVSKGSHSVYERKEKNYRPGSPDFFADLSNVYVVIEAKSTIDKHTMAENQVIFYIRTSSLPPKPVIGVAISGQSKEELTVTYYWFPDRNSKEILKLPINSDLIDIDILNTFYNKENVNEYVNSRRKKRTKIKDEGGDIKQPALETKSESLLWDL